MNTIINFVRAKLPMSRLLDKNQGGIVSDINLPIKQQLGRWTIEYCDRMNRKIDWANHDNCGPCNIQIQTQTQINNGIYVSNNTGKIHININSEK